MNEIERKVDMLISGKTIPRKKTRSRIVTLATTMLIAIALIAGASLIDVYYVQTGTIGDVKSAITITEPDGITVHDTPWIEEVTLSGTIQAGASVPYIYPPPIPDPSGDPIPQYYTITSNADTMIDVFIHVEVTEILSDGVTLGDGLGLTVEVWDLTETNYVDQFVFNGNGDLQSADFQIHVTADPLIDASSTYGYTITMDGIENP